MLRVGMQDSAKTLIVRLEGRLTGDSEEYARKLVTRCNTERELVVDLTEVTFVDSIGEEALSFFSRLGAKFVAEDVYMLDACERLHLPLARNRKWREAAPLLKASRTATPVDRAGRLASSRPSLKGIDVEASSLTLGQDGQDGSREPRNFGNVKTSVGGWRVT